MPPKSRKRGASALTGANEPEAIPRSLPSIRPVTVWTDCSGMECPLLALDFLNVSYVHLQACDVDPVAERFFRAHFPQSPAIYNKDMCRRCLPTIPAGSIDLYVCGFPCPTFSAAGLHGGVQDDRGRIIAYVIHTLSQLQPKTFLLENVKGLATHHPEVLRWIVEELIKISSGRYKIEVRILNSRDHGLPHCRSRLFIIGIDKSLVQSDAPFEWPEPIGHPPLELLLDPCARPATVHDMPPASQGTARSNFITAFRQIAESLRMDPLQSDAVIDLDSSTGRGPHWMDGVVPCLTRARSGREAHWLINRGRRMHVLESAPVMGIQSSRIVPGAVTPNQLGRLLGNGMSVHVLERLFRRILSAAQILALPKMKARWESKAQASFSAMSLSI